MFFHSNIASLYGHLFPCLLLIETTPWDRYADYGHLSSFFLLIGTTPWDRCPDYGHLSSFLLLIGTTPWDRCPDYGHLSPVRFVWRIVYALRDVFFSSRRMKCMNPLVDAMHFSLVDAYERCMAFAASARYLESEESYPVWH